MALTDEGTGTTMLVQPTGFGGNNNGFMDGSWAWIILLLLAFGGGWGMGGFGGGMMWPMMMGGMGGFGMDYLYPWLNNSQHISDGFRDQFLNTQIGDLRTDVNRGFGDVQLGIAGVNQNLCQTGNGIVAALNNGFSGAEISANNRQMANMQQLFGVQSALQNCCCENRAGIADLKYTVAAENCQDRQTISDGIRDVLAAQQAGFQSIKDLLFEDRIDEKNDRIASLERQLTAANLNASQIAQTAQIVDQTYARFSTCPVGTVPVYGETPIFRCNNNGGCGCGNNGFLN